MQSIFEEKIKNHREFADWLNFIHGYNIGVFDFVKICSGKELNFESSCVEIPRKATMLEVFEGEHECGLVLEKYNLS